MPHSCDRCTAPAIFEASHDAAVLFLCGHHGRRLHAGLKAAGWALVTISEAAALHVVAGK